MAVGERERSYLVSCEHGGNHVPARYAHFFAGYDALLQSHRGYDPGSLALGRELARALDAPFLAATTTRLLIELNRSPGHRQLYGEPLRLAPQAIRGELMARYYTPYHQRGERLVAEAAQQGRQMIHVSSHSFTPELHGEVRNADIGLLYDPARAGEVALCRRWLAALKVLAPHLRVRRNYPYTGKSDGFCTWLRRRFGADDYVGIELEVNQKHVLAGGAPWARLREAVVASLLHALHAR